VTGKLDIEEFSMNAAIAATWTKEHIGQEALDFLNTLEPADESHAIGLYHASPRDPVWEYVLSTMLADACMNVMGPRVGAVGHSHVALYFWRQGPGAIAGEHAPGGTELDLSNGDWIINPGGVGQPRDGDPRAAWLLLDLETWHASWRRVEYPIDDAARAIQKAGLPVALSDRLYHGQ
jgi:diadenosine tetraphosphatase ApaH/serine/threonine PP2A family protein phosphatase